MEREAILAVVVQHMKENIDGLELEEIDPAKSMADYGASSLDIVEIVSASMRQLQVRIPRTRLAQLDHIGALVDLLCEVKRDGR